MPRLPRLLAACAVGSLALAGCNSTSPISFGNRQAAVPQAHTTTPTSGPPSPSPTTTSPSPTPSPTPTPTLPDGGRTIFPGHRVVAFYGNGQSKALGVLGHTTPEVAAKRLAAVAAKFATPGHPVLPAFELIVTVAQGYPGPHGSYSHPTDPAIIQRYLDAARKAGYLLVLDIQPGRETFLPEVKRYEKFLLQPDVEVALDSEWRMHGDEVPGRVIGHTDASEINAVSAYLSHLVEAHNLPQKLILLHEFTPLMIRHKAQVRQRPGIALVWHIDGFGSRAAKLYDYKQLHEAHPSYMGFKLFYKQDISMMSPADVLALTPPPDFVSYQ